jgi:phosphate transport system substrate-binding protein
MRRLLGLILIAGLLVPVANSLAQDEVVEYVLPEVDPLLVDGDIVTAGSSTVFPLSVAMVERFTEAGYIGEITVDSIGSGAGFERFCVSAETDVSNASRAINEEELAACEENGRPAIEFRVGTDALAVAISVENDFIGEDGLTIEQLQQIFRSGNSATWADINPDWPAEAILLYSPGTDSGTFDYFVEAIFEDLAEEEGIEAPEELILEAGGIQLSEDDNILVAGVADSPYAIGYFGYAYYQENADVIQAVSINGVVPSAESVEASGDEAYPLARPLFIYSSATIMAEKPQVADFINYYLTNVNEIVTDVGYFPASEEALNAAKAGWCEAIGTCEMME